MRDFEKLIINLSIDERMKLYYLIENFIEFNNDKKNQAIRLILDIITEIE